MKWSLTTCVIAASCLLLLAGGGCSLLIDTSTLGDDDGVTLIAVGRHHVCALRAPDALWCWGQNEHGQLGRGSRQHSEVPEKVAGLLRDKELAGVRSGYDHTCAWAPAGEAYCWGDSGDGQLADGNISECVTNPTRATALVPLGRVIDMSLGNDFTCAIIDDGGTRALYCMGDNAYGQTSAPLSSKVTSPMQVVGVADPQQIAAGNDFACAVDGDGLVWCWGRNHRSQLGVDSSTTESSTPLQVPDIFDAVALSVGDDHACAIVGSERDVWCWGHNDDGQLGRAGSDRAPIQTAVTGATALALGYDYSCAISGETDVLFCWGYGEKGSLGFEDFQDQSEPVEVRSGVKLIAVGAGGHATCSLTNDGRFECWGDNAHGQLATSTVAISDAALTEYQGGERFVRGSSSGENHTCAIDTTASNVWCWGLNDDRQLTGSNDRSSSTPVLVSSDSFSQIATGEAHTCGMQMDTLKCWGANSAGQLGINSTSQSNTPLPVDLPKVYDIDAGGRRTCAAALNTAETRNAAYCWGQFPEDNFSNNPVPIEITDTGTGTGSVTKVAVGRRHVCVLAEKGVYCWGKNASGQLGTGNTDPSTLPVVIDVSEQTVDDIFAGADNSCFLTTSETLYCWGDSSNVSVPTLVPLTSVTAVAVSTHTCAIAGDNNEVYCWGDNLQGELGVPSGAARTEPSLVPNSSDTRAVMTGEQTSCLIDSSGRLECWGSDAYGQRLTERPLYENSPIDITDKLSR